MKKSLINMRAVALLLILSVFLLQFQRVFASAETQVKSGDIMTLNKLGITQYAKIVDTDNVIIDGEKKTEFVVEVGDITNKIAVLEDSDEMISIRVKQDSICNILELHENGDIILDGNKVEVTYGDSEALESVNPPISPRAGATIYWRDDVRYGKAADYSNFLKNDNIKDINLKKTLSNIALSALLTIMGTAMAGLLGAAITFAAGAGAEVYNYLMARDSNTSHLSCKSKVYTHKNYKSGYIPSLFTFIYKYKTVYYSKTQYGGTKTPEVTSYKYNMQG